MLKRNMQQIYINEDWVVRRYMELEKSKKWDEDETEEDNRVFELERELYADDLGVNLGDLPDMDEFDNASFEEAPEEDAIDTARDASSSSDTDSSSSSTS